MRLHEQRRLQHLAVEEIRQRVEMADIVAFAFEARAAAVAQLSDEALDLREGVADDQVRASSPHRRCSHSCFQFVIFSVTW